MGNKEIRGFLFMLIFSSNFCVSLFSSSPLHHQETLPSDFTQNKNLQDTSEQSKNVIDGDENSVKRIGEFEEKIGYAGGARISGGRGANPGDRGGNKTPTQGGNFVPVYAAGAASNRHPNHRGSAHANRIGSVTLFGAAIASFVQVYAAFQRG